jgi:hypothetical protein
MRYLPVANRPDGACVDGSELASFFHVAWLDSFSARVPAFAATEPPG